MNIILTIISTVVMYSIAPLPHLLSLLEGMACPPLVVVVGSVVGGSHNGGGASVDVVGSLSPTRWGQAIPSGGGAGSAGAGSRGVGRG